MNSRGNLADLADRFLQDVLTSAKLGRHLGCIIDLLLQVIPPLIIVRASSRGGDGRGISSTYYYRYNTLSQ